MIARMLLVFLLVLNIGVAAWWLLRPAPPPAPSATDAALPRLLLASEAHPAAGTARPAPPPADAPPPDAQPATHCLRFGPYADETSAREALPLLQAQGAEVRLHEEPDTATPQFLLYMPPLESREAAAAMLARLAQAGYGNAIPITQGEQANGIVIGRFAGQRQANQAERRLRQQGFTAHLAEDGHASHYWLEARVAEGFDAQAARRHIKARNLREQAC